MENIGLILFGIFLLTLIILGQYRTEKSAKYRRV